MARRSAGFRELSTPTFSHEVFKAPDREPARPGTIVIPSLSLGGGGRILTLTLGL